ncbi:hypothetical protein R1flu_026071 [Riccia fluitans]|uniref:Uncharacterized protein n=1 Tax=Riccia fluitans TaxID=41844 RepID=A0ABD1XIY5_9MARC
MYIYQQNSKQESVEPARPAPEVNVTQKRSMDKQQPDNCSLDLDGSTLQELMYFDKLAEPAVSELQLVMISAGPCAEQAPGEIYLRVVLDLLQSWWFGTSFTQLTRLRSGIPMVESEGIALLDAAESSPWDS